MHWPCRFGWCQAEATETEISAALLTIEAREGLYVYYSRLKPGLSKLVFSYSEYMANFKPKRIATSSRDFLAAARLSCVILSALFQTEKRIQRAIALHQRYGLSNSA